MPQRQALKLIGLLTVLFSAIPPAHSQDTSPLTITGTDNAQLKLIKTNPTADTWTLFADETAFTIHDGLSSFPFQIETGATNGAFSIGSNGMTMFAPGFSGSVPQRNLHVLSNEAPGIRLETSGVQAFDIEVNETFFNVVDVTNAFSIPFRIGSGVPSNSLFLGTAGRVGLGTSFPAAQFHIHKSAESGVAELIARFEVADDAMGRLEINNASSSAGVFIPRIQGKSGSANAALIMEGLISNDSGVGPAIVYNASKVAGGAVATRPLVVYRNNNVAKATIAANGDIFATSFNPISSRTLKREIVDLASSKASIALRQLTPVEFIYSDDSSEKKRVGFIAEDVPELVASADRKTVPIMDVVALLARVVKDQQLTIEQQKKESEARSQEQEILQKSFEQRYQKLEEQSRNQQQLVESLIKRLNAVEKRQ